MKKIVIIFVAIIFLNLSCTEDKTIFFDISLINEFENYADVARKYKAEIHFLTADNQIKESQNDGINLIGDDFSAIYKKDKGENSYHFFQLEFSNQNIEIQGTRLIGKNSDEIKRLFLINQDVKTEITENHICYTIMSTEPAPFFIYLFFKENLVVKVSMGFMV